MLDEAALDEIAELWQAVQPVAPHEPTPKENRRLVAVRYAAGCLHLMRYFALSEGSNLAALFIALGRLDQLAGHPDAIPQVLRRFLPRSANPTVQADTANGSLAQRLFTLGVAFRTRFELMGAPVDLRGAIDIFRLAVDATPAGHPERVKRLTALGATFEWRFELTGERSDLDLAIESFRRATAEIAADHPGRASQWHTLGIALWSRFERFGELADLEQAVEVGELAVGAVLADAPERAGCLYSLGIAYYRLFERNKDVINLERATDAFGQSLDTAQADNAQRARCLTGLGNAHYAWFIRTGASADLDKAIRMLHDAVEANPTDEYDRAVTLNNLANAHISRFERLGTAADVEKAIEAGQQALSIISDDLPLQASCLANLGEAYYRRFERTGDEADLAQATKAFRQAVNATPRDHPQLVRNLTGLGNVQCRWFELTGLRADLDEAIELHRRAADAASADHPGLAACLHNLAAAYLARLHAGGPGISREALHALAAEVTGIAVAPSDQVSVGRAAGLLARAVGEHSIAARLLDVAVTALPLVVPRESGWADQEHRLGAHSGLVKEAVAAHCAAGDPSGAVEAAELGRGVLLAAQLDARTDLTDISQAEPELAARFREVLDCLNTPVTAAGITWESLARRRQWWAEHDELLTQIRRRAGFARFLLPPRLADIRPATAGGAVVLLNADRGRADAIIVTSERDPVLVPLPELTLADVRLHAEEMLVATHDTTRHAGRLRRRRVITGILDWLWVTAVQPALDALSPNVSPQSSLPRVWWMPVGLLGLFPLHAAGRPGEAGALDRAVSSYTPTLRALAHVRSRPPAAARRQLTVALECTPGLPDLPGTTAEATALHVHHPDTPPLTGENATTHSVLDALPSATWAHFACHAHADFASPSRSGLHLHDGTLPFPDITRLRLGCAELAYLSACSTAHQGIQLADESLHLASAFQLAGFRHVIASLWPLDDTFAATAARAFYRQFPHSQSADAAPVALHHGIRQIRAQHPERPDLWAPLIHSGA